MKNLQGAVVWITGASSGIGEALVYAFAKAGSRVVLSSRNEQQLHQVRQKANLTEENSLVLPLDLERIDTFGEKYQTIKKKFGKLDVLVNNAGVSQRSYFKDTDFSVCQKIMNTNFWGVVALTKCVLEDFVRQKSGTFVTITSVTGKVATPLRTMYAASKHALHGFFDALRAEHWKDNIDVLLVAPGYVRTNLSYNALRGDGTPQNILDEGQKHGLSPEKCASQILDAIRRKKLEISPAGFKEKLALFLQRFFPSLWAKIVRNVNVR